MPRMKVIKDYGQSVPCDTVIKYNIYMYGTRDDVMDPENDILFKVDLWIVQGTGSRGFHSKTVTSGYIPRAMIDLDKHELYKIDKKTKRRKVIKATNVDVIIDEIIGLFIDLKEN